MIHGLYSYDQFPGVWNTGNHKLLVSGTPEIAIPGDPEKCKLPVYGTPVKCIIPVSGIQGNCNTFTVEKIAGVWDTGEMQNSGVPDTRELGIVGVLDTGK